jgi:iron complex transport system ATP-binding protein
MTPILDVRGLSVSRHGTTVLRSLSWQILPGQFWTILGPNGSGKTSLLSCLTGLLTPSSGTISVLGETFGDSDWIGLRRRIGIVSSSVRQLIDESETALSVIASGLHGQINFWGRFSPAEIRTAHRAASAFRCAHLASRPWAVLSQGERQRILIARALISQPDLLILDEPCAGLDPVARARFLQLISRIASRTSPAVILVSHHVEEIPAACSHILTLRQGRSPASGPIASILTSTTLSRVFGAPVNLTGSPGHWSLSCSPVAPRQRPH